jgi:hypothetical protein
LFFVLCRRLFFERWFGRGIVIEMWTVFTSISGLKTRSNSAMPSVEAWSPSPVDPGPSALSRWNRRRDSYDI